ncbi:2'-5' RNA ligase family protein [Phenylobacterium sp.]|uniref:2'-5' RNA ligase family protein n=1 Tax=Phenylobacterium sp. TaxID=1871053 RepID=UPI00273394F9|nr:2'-5' RNA ligase family protein [Phenylobacterium sp.]MDP3658802.1 2'-5' RNA ligase family protein [Phenylobacterium sp.]
MGTSGLVLAVPQADAAVGRWRRRHDPAARAGMPAHVTLVYPFIAASERDAGVITTLTDLFAAEPKFELSFERLGRFADALWLAPEPDAPVRRLIGTLAQAFPGYAPYGGAFDAATPHLTIARGERRILDGVAAAYRARSMGPINCRLTAASLYIRDGRGWRLTHRFDLG